MAFSEEEGIRFGLPFIGSRALAGTLDADVQARCDSMGKTVADAIREFGLDPGRISEAVLRPPALGYLEFHIEQGPVLEQLHLPLGIVDSITGQSRFEIVFTGQANHAGTTPTAARRDALAGAAEWIGRVEREACATPDLRAAVGYLEVRPGASNVIAGLVRARARSHLLTIPTRLGPNAKSLYCRGMQHSPDARFLRITLHRPDIFGPETRQMKSGHSKSSIFKTS